MENPLTLIQAADTGSNVATVLVLAWLAWKVTHLDKAVSKAADTAERVARRMAFLFGRLGIDNGADDDGPFPN